MKKLILLIAVALLPIIFSTFVSAQTFDMSLEICDTNWQCTNYTQDTCGDRLCLDANFCGVDRNKPTEHIDCPENATNVTTEIITNTGVLFSAKQYANNDFKMSKDIIRIRMLQDETISRYITINSNIDSEYVLSILDESDIGQKILSLSSHNFTLEKGHAKKITFLFDTSQIELGTYVFSVNVSNGYVEDSITILVDVSSNENLLDFLIEVPTKNKIIGDASILSFEIMFPEWLKETALLDYYLIDSTGKKHLIETESINAFDTLKKDLEIPNNLKPGLYALAINLKVDRGSRSKSELFWIHPDTTFYLEEEPAMVEQVKGLTYHFYFAVIFIFVMILLMMSLTLARGPFPHSKYVKEAKIVSGDSHKSENHPLVQDEKNKALEEAYKTGLITKKQLKEFEKKSKKNPKNTQESKTKVVYVKKKISHKFKEHKLFLSPGVLKARVSDKNAVIVKGREKIRSLEELMEYIKHLSKSAYNYHVNGKQNDFYYWVKYKFKQPELAERIKHAKTIEGLNKAFYK